MTRPDITHPESAGTPARAPRPDASHELDLVSLVAGLLAVLLAGLYLVGEVTDLSVRAAMVGALVVGALGAGALAAGLRRLRLR